MNFLNGELVFVGACTSSTLRVVHSAVPSQKNTKNQRIASPLFPAFNSSEIHFKQKFAEIVYNKTQQS